MLLEELRALDDADEREEPLLVRLVAARSAPEALRTPPAEAPAPTEALLEPAPPPLLPPMAEELLATFTAELALPPDDEAEEDDEPPEELPEDPPLEEPPEEPPPPRRPMNAPPPPAKLRLPRSCGPRMVENFSGPVVPVSRMMSPILPPPTVAVRREPPAARLAAEACDTIWYW